MAAGLVISRNVGQAVVIGSGANRVRVEVVEPRNGRVRLRFEAGTNVVINREEIDQAIQGEKMAAAELGRQVARRICSTESTEGQ